MCANLALISSQNLNPTHPGRPEHNMMVAERNPPVKRFETTAVTQQAFAALSPEVQKLFRHWVVGEDATDSACSTAAEGWGDRGHLRSSKL